MAGVTGTSNISVAAREVDFVSSFTQSWEALREALGIIRPIRKEPGTKLTSALTSITLESGNVAEGATIPFSQATIVPVVYGDLTVKKYAKAVTLEAVEKFGADVAVAKTDEEFRNELQSVVLDEMYDFFQTGALSTDDSVTTFQMAIAMAVGLVRDKFKRMRRNVSNIIAIVNTLDLYKYYGSADITVQTAEGITYLKNFLGADTVILSSEIPSGTVIGVPAENVIMYYTDPSDSDYAKLGLDFRVEGETNLIGFHAEGNYKNATGESYAIMGIKLWAEYIDGISVVYMGTNTAATDEAVGTGDGSTKTFDLAHGQVTSISSVTVDGTATTAYTVDRKNGTITFESAPANNAAIVANYKYVA